MDNNRICGIDWLQYRGMFKHKTETDKKGIVQIGNWIFKKSDQRTKDFASLYNVQFCEENTGEIIDFAVICADWNFKERLGKDLQVVKVYNHNFYLYDIKEIAAAVGRFFYIEKLMRVDFYLDFESFDTCGCEQFIKKVAAGDIEIKGGRQTAIVMKNKSYESVTFGTRNTPVRCYLYNKTKEIKKSGKEYIYSFHATNGFAPEKKHVWRLEFSILQPQMVMMEEDGSDFYTFAELQIEKMNFRNIEFLIKLLINRYFIFKTNDTRRKTKTLKLFNNLDCLKWKLHNRKYLSRLTKRTDKTILKALAKLNNELRTFRMQELTPEQINYFVTSRQLTRFYEQNKEFLNI